MELERRSKRPKSTQNPFSPAETNVRNANPHWLVHSCGHTDTHWIQINTRGESIHGGGQGGERNAHGEDIFRGKSEIPGCGTSVGRENEIQKHLSDFEGDDASPTCNYLHV